VCTLSWTATASGYELLFNRDERLGRAPEQAPGEARSRGTGFLAPRDGEAGGTWISVNELGLTCCLLNGYFASRGGPSDTPRSRGLLVLDLAPLAGLELLARHLGELDLAPYEPFVLCGFEAPAPGRIEARSFAWDGLELVASALGPDDLPVCSSGHDPVLAREQRRAEWLRMADAGPMTPERMAAFHRSHLDAPGPASPCMHREDASTRSLVHVAVEAQRVSMRHAPGAPCTTPLGPPAVLARRASPAASPGC